MYDDLTVEQLTSLRTDIRLAYHALISGQQAAAAILAATTIASRSALG